MIYIFIITTLAIFCFLGYHFTKTEEFVLNEMKSYVNNYTGPTVPYLCWFFKGLKGINLALCVPAYQKVYNSLIDHVHGNYTSVMEYTPNTSPQKEGEGWITYGKRIRLEWIDKQLAALKENK